MIRQIGPPLQELRVVVEGPTDPQTRARRERFDRNWAWLKEHASEVYEAHRGKVLCVAGQEPFAADTTEEALALAKAAHPEDDGCFTLTIPRERMARIYAHQRGMDPER